MAALVRRNRSRAHSAHKPGYEELAGIREQAFGEAFDPDKLERLGRYEVHLDRKLERTLTMLIRLQDLRRGSAED